MEHARLDPLRFAKKIMGLQKMYTISKNMDLSDKFFAFSLGILQRPAVTVNSFNSFHIISLWIAVQKKSMHNCAKNVVKLIENNLSSFSKTLYCWLNKRTFSCSAFCVVKKAMDHQDWTIFSGIRSKFNLRDRP